MKIKFLALSLFICAFSLSVFPQSITITPRKITYKRPKSFNKYKRTFVVTYPKVRAATPTLSRKIETAISYERNTGFNIKDEITEGGLDEANYEVNYNKNGILEINLITNFSGAYPSTDSKIILVSQKTGTRVRPIDVFTNLPTLAAKVRKAQQAEIQKAQADYKEDPESKDFDGNEYFSGAKFTVKNLENFSISDKGVTFLYDYEFPHVVLALQPDGTYFYSWAELKPFIKRGGLLAQFIR